MTTQVIDQDSDAIRQAATDYYAGWYEANVERIARSLHSGLAKRAIRKDDQAGVEIGQGHPIDMGNEGIRAHVHPGQGEGLPFEKILSTGLVDGMDLGEFAKFSSDAQLFQDLPGPVRIRHHNLADPDLFPVPEFCRVVIVETLDLLVINRDPAKIHRHRGGLFHPLGFGGDLALGGDDVDFTDRANELRLARIKRPGDDHFYGLHGR